MKKISSIISLLIITLSLSACDSQIQFDGGQIVAWAGEDTYSDDGAFYSRTATISGGDVICHYSTDNMLSIPLCNKPDCTHSCLLYTSFVPDQIIRSGRKFIKLGYYQKNKVY